MYEVKIKLTVKMKNINRAKFQNLINHMYELIQTLERIKRMHESNVCMNQTYVSQNGLTTLSRMCYPLYKECANLSRI